MQSKTTKTTQPIIMDCIGQELKLGDIVFPTNESAVWNTKPFVLTRFGSSDKVQINGGSYTSCKHVIKITEQYAAFKGEAELTKLKSEHTIVEEAVKKKESFYYVVNRMTHYVQPGQVAPDPVFWITKVSSIKENNSHIKVLNEEVKSMLGLKYGDYSNYNQLNVYRDNRLEFGYSGTDITLRKIRELGLEICINQIVPKDSQEYTILAAIRSR